MTSRRKLWLGSVFLYAVFVSWYTDFGGPLTEAEIQTFIANTQGRDLGGDHLLAGRCSNSSVMTRVDNF